MRYKMDVKQILPGLYEVTSESKPGQSYMVDERKTPHLCTCKDHMIRGTEKCKHMEIVEIANFEKVVKDVKKEE